MNILEVIMMICFGAAWPFSIYRSYRSKSAEGKSLVFLVFLQAGYIAGILYKFFYNFDYTIYLYIINLIMVSVDLFLCIRNKKTAMQNLPI